MVTNYQCYNMKTFFKLVVYRPNNFKKWLNQICRLDIRNIFTNLIVNL